MVTFIAGVLVGSLLSMVVSMCLPLKIIHKVDIKLTVKNGVGGIYVESGGKFIGYLVERNGQHWRDKKNDAVK